MIIRLLLLFIVVVGVLALVHWLLKENPKKVARYLRRGALWAAVIAVVLLAATGRLHWLYALIASMVPFFTRLLSLLRYVPILSHLYTLVQNARAARGAPSSIPGDATAGRRSQVETRYLRMTLDHDSGEMEGEVLHGSFEGVRLSSLGINELVKLFEECRREDEESAALLQAYLDRVHGEDWRQHAGAAGAQTETAPATGTMSEAEACEVLGVKPGAARDEVIDAHRRLVQKLHPDRGGSTYLTAKINQAKDVLLQAR